ncbi:prfA [Symbiodinium sp. CCMP2592]|nr:prfA [Symbiodinium sp. CCMP2592]
MELTPTQLEREFTQMDAAEEELSPRGREPSVAPTQLDSPSSSRHPGMPSPSAVSQASTVPGFPTPYAKRSRKQQMQARPEAVETEAVTAPECVDPESGKPGMLPSQYTQGFFSTPPRKRRSERDFSPPSQEMPQQNAAASRASPPTQEIVGLIEAQLPPEDIVPLFRENPDYDIPLEAYEETVAFSMHEVSRDVSRSLWMVYCLLSADTGSLGDHKLPGDREQTLSNHGMACVGRYLLHGSHLVYEEARAVQKSLSVRAWTWRQEWPRARRGKEAVVHIPQEERVPWNPRVLRSQLSQHAAQQIFKQSAPKKKPAATGSNDEPKMPETTLTEILEPLQLLALDHRDEVGPYMKPLPAVEHQFVPDVTEDELWPLAPLCSAEPVSVQARFQKINPKTARSTNYWSVVSTYFLDFLGHRCPRLREHMAQTGQQAMRELRLQSILQLGIVHCLVFDDFVKVGKTCFECHGTNLRSALVARLQKYRQGLGARVKLTRLPVLFLCKSEAHAKLLEQYTHCFMRETWPESVLSLPSDPVSDSGQETYKLEWLSTIVDLLHRSSQKSVRQLTAGKSLIYRMQQKRYYEARGIAVKDVVLFSLPGPCGDLLAQCALKGMQEDVGVKTTVKCRACFLAVPPLVSRTFLCGCPLLFGPSFAAALPPSTSARPLASATALCTKVSGSDAGGALLCAPTGTDTAGEEEAVQPLSMENGGESPLQSDILADSSLEPLLASCRRETLLRRRPSPRKIPPLTSPVGDSAPQPAAQADAASAALLDSQAGPHAARVHAARPTQPEFTLASPHLPTLPSNSPAQTPLAVAALPAGPTVALNVLVRDLSVNPVRQQASCRSHSPAPQMSMESCPAPIERQLRPAACL